MLPASFDIQYYRGDTYTFYINVKDANGTPVDLEAGGYTGAFTIANYRGPEDLDIGALVAYNGSITIDAAQIICTITPTLGAQLVAGPYVYDIQVEDVSGDNVFTYLTGNVYVTMDITGAND